MKQWIIAVIIYFLSLGLACRAGADEGDLIKSDRQAVIDARASGDTMRVIAAKEQLSDDLSNEQDQRRQDLEGITVPLTPDGQGHLKADVLINRDIQASLVVDTGSPVVMLTASLAQKLGLDLTQSKQGYVEVLNGRYKAATVTLNHVKVGEYEADDVQAIVLLEDIKELSDGLLGLSFLSKYHFSLDQEDQKLMLKKREEI